MEKIDTFFIKNVFFEHFLKSINLDKEKIYDDNKLSDEELLRLNVNHGVTFSTRN